MPFVRFKTVENPKTGVEFYRIKTGTVRLIPLATWWAIGVRRMETRARLVQGDELVGICMSMWFYFSLIILLYTSIMADILPWTDKRKVKYFDL